MLMATKKPIVKKGLAKLRQGLGQPAPQIKDHIESIQRAAEHSPTLEDYEAVGGTLDNLKGDALWAYLDVQSERQKRNVEHNTAELREITARISEKLNASGFNSVIEVEDPQEERQATFFRIISECKGKEVEIQANIVDYIDLHLAKSKHQHDVMKEIEQWFTDLLSDKQLEKDFAQELSMIKSRHAELEIGNRNVLEVIQKIESTTQKLKDIGGTLSLGSSSGVKIVDGPPVKEDQITLLVPTESEKDLKFHFTVYLDDEMMFRDPAIQNMAQQYLKGLIFYGGAAKHKNRADKRKVIRLTMRQLDALYNFIARLRSALTQREQEALVQKAKVEYQNMQLESIFREKEMYRIQSIEVEDSFKKILAEQENWKIEKVMLEDSIKKATHQATHRVKDHKSRNVISDDKECIWANDALLKNVVKKATPSTIKSDSTVDSSDSDIVIKIPVDVAHKQIQVDIDGQVKVNQTSRAIPAQDSFTCAVKGGVNVGVQSSPTTLTAEEEELKEVRAVVAHEEEEIQELSGALDRAQQSASELKAKSQALEKVLAKTAAERDGEVVEIQKLQNELIKVENVRGVLETKVEKLKEDVKSRDATISELSSTVSTQQETIASYNSEKKSVGTAVEGANFGVQREIQTNDLSPPDIKNELQNLKTSLGIFRTSIINVLVDQNLIADVPPFPEQLRDTWNINTAAQEVAQDVEVHFSRLADIVNGGFNKMKSDHKAAFQYVLQRKANEMESAVSGSDSNEELRKVRIKLRQKVLDLEIENAQMHENMKSMTKLLEDRRQEFDGQMAERDHNFARLREDRNKIKELTWTLAEALAKLRDETIGRMPERKSIIDMIQLLQAVEHRIGKKLKPAEEKKKPHSQMGIQGVNVTDHPSGSLKVPSKGTLPAHAPDVTDSVASNMDNEPKKRSLTTKDQRTSPPNFATPEQTAKFLSRADGAHKEWLEYTYYLFDPVFETVTSTTREIEQDHKSVQTSDLPTGSANLSSDLLSEKHSQISPSHMHLSAMPVLDPSNAKRTHSDKSSRETTGEYQDSSDHHRKLKSERHDEAGPGGTSEDQSASGKAGKGRAEGSDNQFQGLLSGTSKQSPPNASSPEYPTGRPGNNQALIAQAMMEASAKQATESPSGLAVSGKTFIPPKPVAMVRPVDNSQRPTTPGPYVKEQSEKSPPLPVTPPPAGHTYGPKVQLNFTPGAQVADPMSQQRLYLTSQGAPSEMRRVTPPPGTEKADLEKLAVSGQAGIEKAPATRGEVRDSPPRDTVQETERNNTASEERQRHSSHELSTREMESMSPNEHTDAAVELLYSIEKDLENQVEGIRRSRDQAAEGKPFVQVSGFVQRADTPPVNTSYGHQHPAKALGAAPHQTQVRSPSGQLKTAQSPNAVEQAAHDKTRSQSQSPQSSSAVDPRASKYHDYQQIRGTPTEQQPRTDHKDDGRETTAKPIPVTDGINSKINRVESKLVKDSVSSSRLSQQRPADMNPADAPIEFISSTQHQPVAVSSNMISDKTAPSYNKSVGSTPEVRAISGGQGAYSGSPPIPSGQTPPAIVCSPTEELREEQLLQELDKIRQAQTHLSHIRSRLASLEAEAASKRNRLAYDSPAGGGVSSDENNDNIDNDEPSRKRLLKERSPGGLSKDSLETLKREALLIKKDIKALVQGHRAASRRMSEGSPGDSSDSSNLQKNQLAISPEKVEEMKRKLAEERDQKVNDSKASRKKKMDGLDLVITKFVQHGPAWQQALDEIDEKTRAKLDIRKVKGAGGPSTTGAPTRPFTAGPPAKDTIPGILDASNPFSFAIVGGGVGGMMPPSATLLRGIQINAPREDPLFSPDREDATHQIRVPKTESKRTDLTLAELREGSITQKLKLLNEQREAQAPKYSENKQSNPMIRTHRGEEMLEGPVDLPRNLPELVVVGRPMESTHREFKQMWDSEQSMVKCDTMGRGADGCDPVLDVKAAVTADMVEPIDGRSGFQSPDEDRK